MTSSNPIAVGLVALDEIDDDAIERFQPAWATRAHLLAELGRTEAAERAFARAVSLTAHTGTRRYLERASDEVGGASRPPVGGPRDTLGGPRPDTGYRSNR